MIGSFNSSESTLIFSYGRTAISELFAGASFKLFFSSIEENSASGFGIDIGLKRKIPLFSFGLMFENIINRIVWNTQTERVDNLDRKLKLGVGFYIKNITKHKDNLVISADLDFDFNYEILKFSAGIEYRYNIYSASSIYSISPRVGFYENNIITGIAIGLIRMNSFAAVLDYQLSLTDYFTRYSESKYKGYNHSISLKLGF